MRLVRGGRSGREERVVTVMTGSLGFRGWPLTSAVDGKRMVRAVDWIGGGVGKREIEVMWSEWKLPSRYRSMMMHCQPYYTVELWRTP